MKRSLIAGRGVMESDQSSIDPELLAGIGLGPSALGNGSGDPNTTWDGAFSALATRRARFFYVLYVFERELRTCIDTIRYLLDPEEKWSAHITVRGPYRKPLSARVVNKLNNRLAGNVVFANGVDAFRNKSQTTVFLRCAGTNLESVWHKPDYGYAPHISLYNGPSQDISAALLSMARAYRLQFSFESDQLFPMVSVTGRPAYFLARNYDPDLLLYVSGGRLPAWKVPELELDYRLEIVDKALRYLERLSETRLSYARQLGFGWSHPSEDIPRSSP